MFYEYICDTCETVYVIRKPMKDASRDEYCNGGWKRGPQLYCEDTKLRRVFSYFQLHMNTMVGEGLRRTTEIPDELKPGVKRIQDSKPIMSYPGVPAKRKKAMQ